MSVSLSLLTPSLWSVSPCLSSLDMLLLHGSLKLIRTLTHEVQRFRPQDFGRHRLQPSALLWPGLKAKAPAHIPQTLALFHAGPFTSTNTSCHHCASASNRTRTMQWAMTVPMSCDIALACAPEGEKKNSLQNQLFPFKLIQVLQQSHVHQVAVGDELNADRKVVQQSRGCIPNARRKNNIVVYCVLSSMLSFFSPYVSATSDSAVTRTN